MYLWTCDDHDGHYVGVASVILAETEKRATELLEAALGVQGLDPAVSFTLKRYPIDREMVRVIQNGDY